MLHNSVQNHVAYYYSKNCVWIEEKRSICDFSSSSFSMPSPDSKVFTASGGGHFSTHSSSFSLPSNGSKFAKSRKLRFSRESWKAVGIIEFIRLVFIIPASIVASRKGRLPLFPLLDIVPLSSHALFIIVDCTCHREWNSISICLEFSEYRWMDGRPRKDVEYVEGWQSFSITMFLGEGYWRWWGSAFFTLHGASLL